MQSLFSASQVIFIQFTSSDENQRYPSRIVKVTEGEDLWIGAPTHRGHEGAEIIVDPGTTLILEVLRSDGIRRFPTIARKRIPGDPSILVVDWPQDIERIQRRNDVRVEAAIPVDLELLGRVSALSRRIEAQTIDVSAGGIRVLTTERIPSEVQIRVRIKLPDQSPVVAFGQVLRVHGVDELTEDKRFWAAIRFTAIDERDRQEIARAVFNIQRERLRKGVP